MLANSPFQESGTLFTHFLPRPKHPERLGDKTIPEARAWLSDQALWAVREAACLQNGSHGIQGIDSLCVLKVESEGVWEVRHIHFKVQGTE